MPPFNVDQFARQLLAEALFYDEEYGALGNVSLIDKESVRERYLASYDPDRDTYLVDGQEYGTYGTPEEAAEVLMTLARDNNLGPSFMILFDEDQV
jgi:hypothetical protein